MTNTTIIATFASIDGNLVEFLADGTVAEYDPYFNTVVVVHPTADEYSAALNGMQEAAAVNAEEYAYQMYVYPLMKGGNTEADEPASAPVATFTSIEGSWVDFYADGTVVENDPYTGATVTLELSETEYIDALAGMRNAAKVNAEEYAYQMIIYPLLHKSIAHSVQ